GVVARAAHAAELPARAEVAHPHLRVGLEPAAGEDDGLGVDVLVALRAEDLHADDPALAVLQQLAQAGLVADLDAVALGGLDQEVHEAPAAADRLDVHAAVEVVDAVHDVGLAAEHRNEAHAAPGAHPDD